ncbi:BatD family protein [Plebeiibacterium sediminum]|uniref:BatD family protein n=1 Tax=Plebeiibacterium sediminum TaxID=2992112 RepID=A0AAE3SF08_9BACT|nr:BatD family protein [Plebeiobacterium sediminum]MCW3787048.1 BatD family protein [Plebeiobacterium sediminum]
MRHSILFTLLILFFSSSLFAEDVEFTAQAKSAVLSGEKFQLIYSVNEEGEDLRLPQLNDFTVLMGPSRMTSSSTQIINGKITRSKEFTYTYILKCDKPGKYTLAPAQITVDGEKYESNSLSIEVVKNEGGNTTQQSQSQQESGSNSFSKDDLFITVTNNKSSIYQGEPLVLTTKIYTRINLDNISDIKHPDYRNFIVQDIEDGNNIQWTYEFVNNKQYRVGTLERKVLYAQKSGPQTIEPTEIEFLIKQRISRRSTSIFDDFFDNNYRMVKKRVKSKSINVNVKPFPSPRPKSFSGAVGDLSMKVTCSQNKVKVNDGITIKAVISGTGNHKLMSAPEFNFSTDFDTFDPTNKNNFTNTVSGMKGSNTFEYLIIPRFGGNYTIDPLVFTYFNPKSGKFVTIKSDPIVIEVEKGTEEQNGSTYTPSSINREDVQFIGKDIRFIKTDKTNLKERGTFLFGSLIFYLGYIIPVILFIIAYILNKKKIHENANIHLVKNKKANKMATKRLKKSSTYLKENNHEAFYEEVLKALYTYLSDKLFLPVSELSKEKAADLITKRGVSEEVKNELLEVLDTCEFARFSPASGETEQMDKLYNKALNNISKLDNQIKK